MKILWLFQLAYESDLVVLVRNVAFALAPREQPLSTHPKHADSPSQCNFRLQPHKGLIQHRHLQAIESFAVKQSKGSMRFKAIGAIDKLKPRSIQGWKHLIQLYATQLFYTYWLI